MANTKSSKKRAVTNEVRRNRNVARLSDIKTACKKVEEALMHNQTEKAVKLLQIAESKVARGAGKKVLKKRSAARSISRLARKLSSALKLQSKKATA
jgi:small subunit ribosomal protein S20